MWPAKSCQVSALFERTSLPTRGSTFGEVISAGYWTHEVWDVHEISKWKCEADSRRPGCGAEGRDLGWISEWWYLKYHKWTLPPWRVQLGKKRDLRSEHSSSLGTEEEPAKGTMEEQPMRLEDNLETNSNWGKGHFKEEVNNYIKCCQELTMAFSHRENNGDLDKDILW